MNNFDQSLEQERNIRTMHDALILEALKKVCAANEWTFEHSRNSNEQEDKAGADLLLKVREQLQPLKVDLKLSYADVWRVPIEWRVGANQHGKPWAIAGKSDLILWVNPKHDHAYWANGKALALRLLNLTDLERDYLISSELKQVTKLKDSTFETLVNLLPPSYFVHFVKGFGGVV